MKFSLQPSLSSKEVFEWLSLTGNGSALGEKFTTPFLKSILKQNSKENLFQESLTNFTDDFPKVAKRQRFTEVEPSGLGLSQLRQA